MKELTILFSDNLHIWGNLENDTVTIDSIAHGEKIIPRQTFLDMIKERPFFYDTIGVESSAVASMIPSWYRLKFRFIPFSDTETNSLFSDIPMQRMECSECDENRNLIELEIDGSKEIYCLDCIPELEKCKDCEEIYKKADMTEIDGEFVCQGCYDDHYYTCENCNEIHHTDDTVEIHTGRRNTEFWCENCTDRRAYKCDDCGNYFYDYGISDGNRAICQECLEDGSWYTCDSCGVILMEDETRFTDNGCYCESCAPEEETDDGYSGNSSSCINQHWSKFRPIFHGEGNLFFGMELEIDDGENRNSCAEEIYTDRKNDLYIETDGSLGSSGLELVFHPRTIESWDDYRIELEKICTIARDNGYKSHDTTTCGLHIHASRNGFGETETEIQETIGKVVFMFEHFFPDFLRYSRRTEGQLASWAKRYCFDGMETGIEYYKKGKGENDRYHAINLVPAETVEFRFFRGSLKIKSIMGALHMVNRMIAYAKNYIKKDIEKGKFDDIIAGNDTILSYQRSIEGRRH
jgi:hypothetical protein